MWVGPFLFVCLFVFTYRLIDVFVCVYMDIEGVLSHSSQPG